MTFLSHPGVVTDIHDNLHSTYFLEPLIEEETHHTVVDDSPSKYVSHHLPNRH